MRRHLLMAASAAAVLAGLVVMPASPAHAEACVNWSRVASWGKASGTNCTNIQGYVTVTGRVTDTSADGHCVYVRVSFAGDGSTQDSGRACPSGDTTDFELWGLGNSDITLHRLQV